MGASPTVATTARRFRMWLGAILLGVGFLGHYFAAIAIGGSDVAYRDQMADFFGLALLPSAIFAALGWRCSKGQAAACPVARRRSLEHHYHRRSVVTE